MAASIESRVPFLDHELVEHVVGDARPLQAPGLADEGGAAGGARRDRCRAAILTGAKMGFPVPFGPLAARERSRPRSSTSSCWARARGPAGSSIAPRSSGSWPSIASGARQSRRPALAPVNLEIWQRVFLDGEEPEALPAGGRRDAHPLGEGRRALALNIAAAACAAFTPSPSWRADTGSPWSPRTRRGEDDGEAVGPLPECERVVVGAASRCRSRGAPRFALALARSWLSPLPVDSVQVRGCPALARGASQRLIAAGAVDVCVADFLAAAPNVPLGGRVPTRPLRAQCRAHDLEAPRARSSAAGCGGRCSSSSGGRCGDTRRGPAARVADGGGVRAGPRAARRPGARRADIRAIPTGVDTSYFRPNGAAEMPDRLVFTGSMDWYPNEDADAALHRRHAARDPARGAGRLAHRGRPEARAPGCAPRRRRPASRVTGTVADVRPHVAEAAVCVVPLRVGGGTRLKIFEALAMGKAVVSTTVGAEGLPLVPGEHYLAGRRPGRLRRAPSSRCCGIPRGAAARSRGARSRGGALLVGHGARAFENGSRRRGGRDAGHGRHRRFRRGAVPRGDR